MLIVMAHDDTVSLSAIAPKEREFRRRTVRARERVELILGIGQQWRWRTKGFIIFTLRASLLFFSFSLSSYSLPLQ